MPYQEQFLPAALIVIVTLTFFIWERLRPGRTLPCSPGWYIRAAAMNLVQLTLIGIGGLTWNRFFRDHSLLQLGAWTSLFGAAGEYFYHSNIATPKWLGWFIQRPEHHSVHHELDVHKYNFGDITWWDRLFGTFKETDDFVQRCGFPGRQEELLMKMLRFKDVYQD